MDLSKLSFADLVSMEQFLRGEADDRYKYAEQSKALADAGKDKEIEMQNYTNYNESGRQFEDYAEELQQEMFARITATFG
jgi:hypothetical protein